MMNFEKLQCQLTVSPLGAIALAASDRGLAGVWFVGQKHFPVNWPDSAGGTAEEDAAGPTTPDGAPPPANQWLAMAVEQLARYFDGKLGTFTVPLDLSSGTAFQQAVWQVLTDIPHGTSRSYGDIAHAMGKPGVSRAIGHAVGRNPVSVIVPCHRVLGASGQLTGYAGGLDRKRELLALESGA